MLIEELNSLLQKAILKALTINQINSELEILSGNDKSTVAKIKFQDTHLATRYITHLMSIGIGSLTNKGQPKKAQTDGIYTCIYVTTDEIKTILDLTDPTFSLEDLASYTPKKANIDIDSVVIEENELEQKALSYIAAGEALVRVCTNREDADFYVDQLADPNNRPPRALNKKNIAPGTKIHKHFDAISGPQPYTSGLSRHTKASDPKHTYQHTLKYSTTLWPTKPAYMQLFLENAYIGMCWHLAACDTKNERYIYSKNVRSNDCQWLVVDGKDQFTSLQKSITTIAALKTINSNAVARKDSIQWNELLVGYPLGRIDALFCQSNAYMPRIIMLVEMYRYQKKLNLTHNIPLFIVHRDQNPAKSFFKLYSYEDRLNDIISMLSKNDINIELAENNYEIFKKVCISILKRRSILDESQVKQMIHLCDQRGISLIQNPKLNDLEEKIQRGEFEFAFYLIKNLRMSEVITTSYPLEYLQINPSYKWRFLLEATKHSDMDLAVFQDIFELIYGYALPSKSPVMQEAILETIYHMISTAPLEQLTAKDPQGDTLLHLAVKYPHFTFAVNLVQRGANLYEPNNNSETPLSISINENNLQANVENELPVKLIDAYPLDPQSDTYSLPYITQRLVNSHLARFYVNALREGKINRLKWVLCHIPIEISMLINDVFPQLKLITASEKEAFFYLLSSMPSHVMNEAIYSKLFTHASMSISELFEKGVHPDHHLMFIQRYLASQPSLNDILNLFVKITNLNLANKEVCLTALKIHISKGTKEYSISDLDIYHIKNKTLSKLINDFFTKIKWAEAILAHQKSDPTNLGFRSKCYALLSSLLSDKPKPPEDTSVPFEKEADSLMSGWFHSLSQTERNREDSAGNTPLMIVLQSSFSHLALSLIKDNNIYKTNNIGETPLSLALRKSDSHPNIFMTLIHYSQGPIYSDFFSKNYLSTCSKDKLERHVIDAVLIGSVNMINWLFANSTSIISYKIFEEISNLLTNGLVTFANPHQQAAFRELCFLTKIEDLVTDYQSLITLFVSTFQITLNDLTCFKESPLKIIFLIDYFKDVLDRLILTTEIMKFFNDHQSLFVGNKELANLVSKLTKNRLLTLKSQNHMLDLQSCEAFLKEHSDPIKNFFNNTLNLNAEMTISNKICTLFSSNTPNEVLEAEALLANEQGLTSAKLTSQRRAFLPK